MSASPTKVLQELELRIWQSCNHARSRARVATGEEQALLWARYEGMKLARLHVLEELCKRGGQVLP